MLETHPTHSVTPAQAGAHLEIPPAPLGRSAPTTLRLWHHLRMDPGLRRDDTESGERSVREPNRRPKTYPSYPPPFPPMAYSPPSPCQSAVMTSGWAGTTAGEHGSPGSRMDADHQPDVDVAAETCWNTGMSIPKGGAARCVCEKSRRDGETRSHPSNPSRVKRDHGLAIARLNETRTQAALAYAPLSAPKPSPYIWCDEAAPLAGRFIHDASAACPVPQRAAARTRQGELT